MKIGIDARLWNETGVGRYIRNLVRELQEFDQKNEYVLFVLTKDCEEIAQTINNHKWKIQKADIRWHSVKEQIQFTLLINKENLDLMHFPYFSMPVMYRKPFVVTIHDLIIYHFPTGKASTLPFPLYKVKQYGYRFVLSYATHHARKIIVPLESVKQDVSDNLHVPKENIVVTPEGFDAAVKVPESKPVSLKVNIDIPYFLYVGNAYPHKNVMTILEAFVQVKKTQKNVQLFFVGKEDYFSKELKTNIPEDIQSDIHFIQNADDLTLGFLYKHALALVSASRMEGFGLPALEAAANGCLLLLSDIQAYKENWQNAAVFFDPKDIQGLSNKMSKILMDNKKEFATLRIEAQKRVKNFSWEKMAKETLGVYESSISLR